MEEARLSIALLWKSNRKATYKDIVRIADQNKLETPWDDCDTWEAAFNIHEGGLKSLFAKSRTSSSF
ncbi:MAG: hypothetical protein M3O09_06360 [Acidobacteriota bacterium]|nr:hypothetical protein [Acidobacteriota bacterium]